MKISSSKKKDRTENRTRDAKIPPNSKESSPMPLPLNHLGHDPNKKSGIKYFELFSLPDEYFLT